MFSSTNNVSATHLDASSWDHDVLADEDTAWLLQQQEHLDLSNDWLSGLDLDDLEMEVDHVVQQLQHTQHDHQSSPRSVADVDSLDVIIADTTELLPKEELRKHKNRQSAVRSRQRTRERMAQLEEMAIALELRNRQLHQTLCLLQYQMQLPMPTAAPAHGLYYGAAMMEAGVSTM